MSARAKTSPQSWLDRRLDGLFDFPLPLPSGTIYDELGTGPDVPDDEIGWAVKELNDRRTAERAQLQTAINRAYTQVPGLAEAIARLAELRATTDASPKKLQELQEKVSAMERRLVALSPDINESRRREKELEDEIKRLHAMKLDQPLYRRTYDELHPPLALLKIVPAARDQFFDTPRVLLTLLRREITAFLRARGESVTYSTDFERDDFTADFAAHPLLDGPEED